MTTLISKRAEWISNTVQDCLGCKETHWEECIQVPQNAERIEAFLTSQGPNKIFFFYQIQEQQQQDDIKEAGQLDPQLFVTYGDTEGIKDKAVWFLRNVAPDFKGVLKIKLDEPCDNDIVWGEITPNPIPQLCRSMELFYHPAITRLCDPIDLQYWQKCNEESVREFAAISDKFNQEVKGAIDLMTPGQEFFKLDAEELKKFENDSSKMDYYNKKFVQWIDKIKKKLNDDSDSRSTSQDQGPRSELEYWRTRMQDITNWNEQLKSHDFQFVKRTLMVQSKHDQQGKKDDQINQAINEYNRLDLLLTDKLNEAKDNVKYLATLEKFIEPLYVGTPQQIIDSLPALMNAIKMVHTIARFYNTSDKMTGLFMKITNQMIKNCKERIVNGAKNTQELWKREPSQLIDTLHQCIKLYREYKSCYNETKKKVAEMPKGKQFDFSETQIFQKFEHFVRRLNKLIDIFLNIQQFNALAKHNLEDMDQLTHKFNEIIEQFKKTNKNNLLDTTNINFDRDWVEFNVQISKLDQELQAFIDSNFARFSDIEYSLKLLKKFESTIRRDPLKHNLKQKYNSILHNYALELDNINTVFKDSRDNPQNLQYNIVRNMPSEAGKIVWAKHLFQKITAPIQMFPEDVIQSGEIKKYYAVYNALGKSLTIYELWYKQNWVNEIERSKAALQATLIVRHEKYAKLWVNFDYEILQLIREAKCLDRQGVDIPESARIILLQEEKFKMYKNELEYALKEYERINSKIKPICKELLQPHLDDLELKLRPGMVTLTWTSMNIDQYLTHIHEGLKKLEQLIINVNDIIENRIENNLKQVSKFILVNLPNDAKPMTLEEFVSEQENFIQKETNKLISKNLEVERAVDDLITTICLYPLDPHIDRVSEEQTKKIKRYYFWYFYQALLNSTQNSLNAMKYRVCGKKNSSNSLSNLKPFFEVQVQLQQKEVTLSPSLDQIQKAINRAATALLRCSKKLYNWNQSQKDNDKKDTFYDMIAQDKEIVKVILLLTGSIQGTRNKVNEFLRGFENYNWMFQENIQEQIKAFSKSQPTLQDYEDKLKKFTNIEEEIDRFPESHKIGAMELKTKDICDSLKRYSKEWKKFYSEDLHQNARSKLDILTEQTKTLQISLSKDVKDINSLGHMMATLEEIRKKQAEIDMQFNPVLEMYQLLDTHLPGGITDKDEQDNRSLLRKNWDQLIAQSESKRKLMQEQQGKHLKTLKQQIKQFVIDVENFRKNYEQNGPMVPKISPQEAMERLRAFENEFLVKKEFYNINRRGEELFGLQKQSYPDLEKTESEIKNLKKLYDLYDTVIKTINSFKEKSWAETTRDDLFRIEEDASKYGENCTKLPADLKGWDAYKELKQAIEDLKAVLPIITDLKKDSIEERHWQQICEITKKQLNYQNPDLMLMEDIINCGLLEHQEDIIDITDSAEKQKKIRQGLNEIDATWASMEFDFGFWGKREPPLLLAGAKVAEILEKLDEDQTSLAATNAARHVGPFKQEVESKIRVFSDVNATLDLWFKVQKLWQSLEPVFTGGDIARQMPREAKTFAGIDKNWGKIMEKAVETKKVIPCCQNDMLKDFLPDLNNKLEECQKSLNDYLEGKRKAFARFYFVSDSTQLKILSSGSEPTSVQEDFEKLFDAISKVNFEKDASKKGQNIKMITAIYNVIGNSEEMIPLDQNVSCDKNIEIWLLDLEKSMQDTLLDICRKSVQVILQQKNQGLKKFAMEQPAQVGLLGIQILWTQFMTEGLEGQKKVMEDKKKQISLMMDYLSEMCLEDLPSKIHRVKVETLVTIQVHQYDISQEIKCKDVNDFEWQKQTRMYWKNEEDNCFISITDWDAKYCYEYLGAKERLCVTPLTDRCYITLAQAMSMYYGGAPAGPAGTGKTETVKDLGRSLGLFVVVTNCSDQHRYRDMAKIFKGLVQSGLWGCFDEFNRIDLEVLSVVAMQVESITSAKKQHLEKFMFPEEPNPIPLNLSVSYFITMNPGYAGRQELPENLKVLFRGVTMMVPDREIIMKVKLASVGYKERGPLSKKFNVLYRLCEEQLSKQRHYDFGLRNILSVLRTAGNTLRQERNSAEEMLLMRSLRDMNLSKLVADDIPLFNGLLADIFPKQTNPPKMTYPDIEKAVPQVIDDFKTLVNSDSFNLKIIQLYETYLVRHGFMLVGPTGSGKTAIAKILTETLSKVDGVQTRMVRMNPKAITSQQMYGVDIAGDWVPGVFSTIWEKSNNRALKHNTWIVCDGPVDAIWIENLNTVLDDNKILTLANGERILMTENCKLTFEVQDLNNASPATVSRCGQVYVSPTDLGWQSILDGWLLSRKNYNFKVEEIEKLNKIFQKYFQDLDFVNTPGRIIAKEPAMKITDILQITQFLNLLNGVLIQFTSQQRQLENIQLERIFIYAYSWAFGGLYESDERNQFHEFLREKGCPLPQKKENQNIFDFYIDQHSAEWRQCIPDEWVPPTGKQGLNFSALLIPTLDSLRCEQVFNYIFGQESTPKSDKVASLLQSVCLAIGGAGTAKTSSVLMYSGKFDKEKMLFKRINFSSATTPKLFQQTIEAECDFKVGKDFAPPQGKQMTIFIDDMSMPEINKWGDQITLEIVRQLVEQGGFYSLDKALIGQFKNIKNLQYIGAMNHPGGGRNDIPNRMKRHCFIFNMILPLDITPIYQPIITHTFAPKYFSDEVNKVINGLTRATIELWNKVKSTMLPTPTKFHYLFNMRELARIFKGILGTNKKVIQSASQAKGMKPEVFLVGLWRHECERVFVDKMTNYKDKDQVQGYINEISLDNFSFLDSQIQENFGAEKQFHMCYFLREDIRQEDGTIEVPAERIYEGVAQINFIKQRGQALLEDYNTINQSKKMNLVLFDDAVKHLLRISRIIMQPRSSALLVGVGGSGKQSLTRLASFIQQGNFLQQIIINKSYGEKDLKEDIKIGFEKAGKDNRPVVFLMTDAEVKNEEFLEYINMILSTGEIPGLFQKDEKEIAIGAVRNEYVKSKNMGNVDPPQSDLWEYFIERIRDNYHIVLAFSPVGQKFRDRSRKFPALFNECTIDWFLPWPEEALVSVAETFIKNFNQLDTKPEIKVELMKHMGNVHLMVNSVTELYFQSMRRQVYVTPKSFLSFLNSYKELYLTKYEELDKQENSYKIGLSKIDEATKAINVMEIGLKEEEAKLKIAQDQAQVLLQDLEIEQNKAKKKNDEVEKTTKECQQQNEMIAREREAAQKDLEEAMPALRAAQKAVESLKPADIVEMKTNRNPHEMIKYIMDCIVIFFQGKLAPIQIEEKYMKKKDPKPILFLKDSYEEAGKQTLGNMDFMNNLKKFPMDEINEETIELLDPYMRQRDNWFTVQVAQAISQAASGILDWAFAIALYHEKSKIVKPKQIFLKLQEARLAQAQKDLAKSREQLAEIQALLKGLKDNYDKSMAEKAEIENKATKTKKKINTARQLISSLSGEKERWGLGAREIEDKKRRLVGDVSLSCAFISYCGPFNSEFRQKLAAEYFENDMKRRGIPVTPKLELTKFLVDDATIGEWNIQGLPKDDLSIQNGIMVTQSTRFCLFIDPQTQGQNWVTKKYEDFIDADLSITNQNHPKFKDRFLKHCLENGRTLIVENILNEVDTVLDPVLEKQYTRKGKNLLINVGGTIFDYDPKFNLILTCRLSNPNFSPELSAKVTIIDFTVTQGGLEQQLLGKVISKEQKALEDSLTALLAGVNQNVKQLKQLDQDLLERLTSSQGNLLDDAELIEVLNNTKTQAKEVDAKIKDAQQKTEEIQIKREQYRPVAIRGSALYFTMIEVAEINWMYNSSLGQFLNLFNESIDNAPKAQLPTKRVENIIEELTFHVFKYVNRGLFEKDKTAFMLMMCFKIQTTAQVISSVDIGMFLKAGASLDIKNERSKPPLSFINDKIWLNIIALSRHSFGPVNESIPVFKDLPDSITKNEAQWKAWIERNDPENSPIPDFSEKIAQFKDIGPFLTLCLIRALREDRTRVASVQYIGQTLGQQYTSPISYPIESIWQSSTSYDPVLFLLSAGADPTTSIDDLAKKKKKFPVEKVSMGEGQEKVADKQIKKCAEEGGWIVLQNCHLGLKYMEEIEQNIINPEQPKYPLHEDFRLWITCEENPKFPLGLLQKTLKVTNEPPKGLQAGLHKTFHTVITQESIEKVEHPYWHALMFTVCFMHSIVIERKKFGPLGWCIPYEFNYSDLEASLSFVEKYLTNQMQTPSGDGKSLYISMPVIKYMVCEVQYGGRITDDLDRELFVEYGEKYFKEGIFQNNYVFDTVNSEGGKINRFNYEIPSLGPQQELSKWQEYIAKIPPNDNPEVFGLHANADLTFRLKESLEMINTVTETRPKESQVGGGKTREEIVQEKARELLSKLPPDYNMLDVREMVKKIAGPKQLNDKGLSVPLNIFLFQELQRMQRVIGLVRKLFEDTILAIDGQIIMTPEILDAINAIYDAKVPATWLYDPSGAEISWLLSSLGSWYGSLIERNKQLYEWMKNGRPNTYWLTGFFNPQGFLTGMKQEVTRLHKKPDARGGKDDQAWSLDDVVYKTQVEDAFTYENIKNYQQEGVYIHGLFLEGCKWTKQLEDADPKKMFSPLPLLHVTAINKKKGSGQERDSILYNCPVYKYPRRNDKYLVFRVGLQCDSPQKWKLRGVALLCTTEQ